MLKFALWLLFLCYGLYAKEAVSTTRDCVLDISDVIQMALKTHPSISASREILKSAEAQVEGAKWNYFPTPSIELSQTSSQSATIYRIEQPLWTGGKLDAAKDFALSKKGESEATLEESAYSLASTVIYTLHTLIQSEKNLQAIIEGKRQLQALQRMLSRRIDAGVSSRADGELLKSRLLQVNTDLKVALSKRNIAIAQIELLINQPLRCDIEFSDSYRSSDLSLESAIEEMMRTHPALKKLSTQVALSEAEKKKAQSIFWPNVSLRAEHQSGSLYNNTHSSENLFYVSVSLSPGAGLSALSNVESAKSKVLQTRYEVLSKKLELSNEMMQDYDDYHSALERIEGMKESIEASQNVLESYTRLFLAGKRQWLDLLNSSRELTRNQMSLADLEANVWLLDQLLYLKSGKMKLCLEM